MWWKVSGVGVCGGSVVMCVVGVWCGCVVWVCGVGVWCE